MCSPWVQADVSRPDEVLFDGRVIPVASCRGRASTPRDIKAQPSSCMAGSNPLRRIRQLPDTHDKSLDTDWYCGTHTHTYTQAALFCQHTVSLLFNGVGSRWRQRESCSFSQDDGVAKGREDLLYFIIKDQLLDFNWSNLWCSTGCFSLTLCCVLMSKIFSGNQLVEANLRYKAQIRSRCMKFIVKWCLDFKSRNKCTKGCLHWWVLSLTYPTNT